MSNILMQETWADRDLNNYLRKYAKGSEETERRTVQCDFCGDDFDIEDGKVIDLFSCSHIKVRGQRPKQLYICNSCYVNAEDLED